MSVSEDRLVGRQDRRLKDWDVAVGGSPRSLPDGMCICGMCRSCRASDRAAGMPVIDPERPIDAVHVRVKGARVEDRTPSARQTSRQRLAQSKKDQLIEVAGRAYAPNAPVHGTSSTYKHWYCRCGPCTTARAMEK